MRGDDFDQMSSEALEAMVEAAREVQTCERVLAKTGDTVLTQLMNADDRPAIWRHYPAGDVYDPVYHAQYYYHLHPETERLNGEHGHFHTFLRPFGMPEGVRPTRIDGEPMPMVADDNEALSHLIAIATTRSGRATRLFTTNRWVTGETWYSAADVARMLDSFVMDVARPCWAANRWITALMRLFRPQILALLHARDHVVADRDTGRPEHAVLEDRGLEVVTEQAIDVTGQIRVVEQAWRRRRRRRASPTPILP